MGKQISADRGWFSHFALSAEAKRRPSLTRFENNLIFRVREGNVSVQKTLLFCGSGKFSP